MPKTPETIKLDQITSVIAEKFKHKDIITCYIGSNAATPTASLEALTEAIETGMPALPFVKMVHLLLRGPVPYVKKGLQDRVMATGRDGLPVEPMLAKIQEGRTKGVPAPALERACDRMDGCLRAADRIMTRSREHGLEPAHDPTQQRRMHREMAMQMWRGMDEEGYGHLEEQARLRLRDGSCGITDLVSAGETATRLREEGVDRGRATRVTGEALRHGYRSTDMAQMQYIVMHRHRTDGSMDRFMGDMEYCLGTGMQVEQMYEYMMQHGWMGPGHMSGPWGAQHMDNMGGPGHHGGGGVGDDGHHDGMGDDDHHGGM